MLPGRNDLLQNIAILKHVPVISCDMSFFSVNFCNMSHYLRHVATLRGLENEGTFRKRVHIIFRAFNMRVHLL